MHRTFSFILVLAAALLCTASALAADVPSRAPAGWFPVTPAPDSFGPSAIDLRYLNEKFAGEHGFIQVRGDHFVHGQTGQPERFWAVAAGPRIIELDHASIDTLARTLAKLGVNLVRFHGNLWNYDAIDTIDANRLDHLFYFVAALKKQGIYTGLSIYFPLWMKLQDPALGYTGQYPFGLLFFDDKFQQIYRRWWRATLATVNPYTHQTLAQDPAVAFAELVNEDSLMFWTFRPYDTIPAPATEELERQFGQWAAQRYGSLDQALGNWGYERVKGDDRADGRAGFIPLWQICQFKSPRAQDTVRFLTFCQQQFFSKTMAYLRQDLHFQGCLYGSNWITASDTLLGPLDKYSNTLGDFMDRHGYFGGPHQGPRAGYALAAGDQYADRSALLLEPDPQTPGSAAAPSPKSEIGNRKSEIPSLPIMDLIYNSKPSITTEINWDMPNRYRADLPLLCAGYGLLQGSSGFCFFCLTDPGWETQHTKFGIQSPVIMGQFPATALIYRRGLVQQGQTVVHAELKLDDLYALKGSPVARAQNLDELRAKDLPPNAAEPPAESLTAIDPLSFLAGRVEMNISENGGPSRTADLTPYIDRANQKVLSTTGQLKWDYAAGLVTMNAPGVQGATGFLQQAGTIQLGDVTIQTGMEYGTVLLVAMDGKPLRESGKMLLQVMSEDANFGWSAPGNPGNPGNPENGLRTLRDVGGPPIVVRDFAGSVDLHRPDAGDLRVTALDFNGYPDTRQTVGTAHHITLLKSTMFYLIEK